MSSSPRSAPAVAPRRRAVCVFTGARAEYGLLRWTIRGLRDRDDVGVQLLVSGAHLSPEFGLTYREIERDGLVIDECVEMLLSTASAVGVAKSFGMGVLGLADALARLRPDLLVVLGDRYETMAAATSAMLLRIPIAHIAGGEATEGAVDESIRHAITKMAHLHFVATDEFRQRVLQLGEEPDRVVTVGAPGLDGIAALRRLSRPELEAALDVRLARPTLLVTYHPVTGRGGDTAHGVTALLDALAQLDARIGNATVVFTLPNADTGSAAISQAIQRYADSRPGRARLFTSLGQQRYLSLLSEADVVVGNSSSGLIEAPATGTPTVNIGQRQRGRPRATSVIDCPAGASEIVAAVGAALDPKFQEAARSTHSPYGKPGAAVHITEVLATFPLEGLLEKSFQTFHPAHDGAASSELSGDRRGDRRGS